MFKITSSKYTINTYKATLTDRMEHITGYDIVFVNLDGARSSFLRKKNKIHIRYFAVEDKKNRTL